MLQGLHCEGETSELASKQKITKRTWFAAASLVSLRQPARCSIVADVADSERIPRTLARSVATLPTCFAKQWVTFFRSLSKSSFATLMLRSAFFVLYSVASNFFLASFNSTRSSIAIFSFLSSCLLKNPFSRS
jgi:hypothetical protein